MTVKITGFADEIAPELTAQIAGLKGLGMSYVEMRGVDGENLIYHTDEKVEQIKKTLDDNGIRLSALGSPLGKILITDDFTPHFEEFKRAVEISHKMECPTIRMFSFYLPQESDPAAYEGEVFDRIGNSWTMPLRMIHCSCMKMKKISMEQWLRNAKNSWIPFTGIILKLFLTLPTLYSVGRIRWKPMRC